MKPEIIHKTRDVYGITRDLPENYVSRKGVDDEFVNSLDRKKHIVIFGSSKQGKTCLRKKCLSSDKYILIQCSGSWDISQINQNILKRAGYELETSTKLTSSGKSKITATISESLLALLSQVGSEREETKSKETIHEPLELDTEDVNDVIEALNKIRFNKYIILEDFHYLKQETQEAFSIELKAFHENSDYCFIVIGVWSDENKLIVYNGDLTSRVISINADKWSKLDLHKVIITGGQLLNISFSDKIRHEIVDSSYENVYIVQEACFKACESLGISETQERYRYIDEEIDVEKLIKKIVNQQSGRYNSFLANFADGFQDTSLQMHKWILYAILMSELSKLDNGLKFHDIKRCIRSKHPRGGDLNIGNLTQALKSTVSLQTSKGIKPIIVDYDDTNSRLHVVDKGFMIWLRHQDKNELLEICGLPTD